MPVEFALPPLPPAPIAEPPATVVLAPEPPAPPVAVPAARGRSGFPTFRQALGGADQLDELGPLAVGIVAARALGQIQHPIPAVV